MYHAVMTVAGFDFRSIVTTCTPIIQYYCNIYLGIASEYFSGKSWVKFGFLMSVENKAARSKIYIGSKVYSI